MTSSSKTIAASLSTSENPSGIQGDSSNNNVLGKRTSNERCPLEASSCQLSPDEENDQGVYGVQKSLMLSDCSPLIDSQEYPLISSGSTALKNGAADFRYARDCQNCSDAVAEGRLGCQSSDSNFLDDDALFLVEDDSEAEEKAAWNLTAQSSIDNISGIAPKIQPSYLQSNAWRSPCYLTESDCKNQSTIAFTNQMPVANAQGHECKEAGDQLEKKEAKRLPPNTLHLINDDIVFMPDNGEHEQLGQMKSQSSQSSIRIVSAKQCVMASSASKQNDIRHQHLDVGRQIMDKAPSLSYSILRDGIVFHPGLPPSLSVESLHRQGPMKHDKKRKGRKMNQNEPNQRQQQHHHHRHHHSQGHRLKQKTASDVKFHGSRTRSKIPPAPKSSPTVSSRADYFGSGSAEKDGAVLNNFSSFRIIIERIKRWFLHKSRKILARNLFSSSVSSLASSSLVRTSSTTSLCDSNPSLTDFVMYAPIDNSGTGSQATGQVPRVKYDDRCANNSSSSSIASTESTNSLLELKKRLGKQRLQMAAAQAQQQQQPHSSRKQQHRQRAYLQVHGKTAFTVTSTISCPTGPPVMSKRGKRHRHNPETSTVSTGDDHCSLQLSYSWPLVDRLASKLGLVQQNQQRQHQDHPYHYFQHRHCFRHNDDTNNHDCELMMNTINNASGLESDATAFYNETGVSHTYHPAHTNNSTLLVDTIPPAMLNSSVERRAGWRHYLTQTQDSARDSVCSDCAIPFQDLEFGDCVRDSDGHKIFSGRWYGSVMIHLFSGFSDRDVGAFWSEVHKMVTLRHDNVALFMGAAVERSALAIVISVQTHISLFDQIHINGNCLTSNVLTIGRQLAQGMGYLHSRNIVLGHLNSRNVFIDGKLKISMADCSKPRRDFMKNSCACLSRGVITYLAPELLKSLSIVPQQQHVNLPPKLCFQQAPTTDTDVYAFGTLMYEVAFSEFPFAGTPVDVIIYQISAGIRPAFDSPSVASCKADGAINNSGSANLLGSHFNSIKQLIEDCWCHDPLSRPFFKDIYRHIQEISPTNQEHRRRCSSVPERLNHLSSQRAGGILYY